MAADHANTMEKRFCPEIFLISLAMIVFEISCEFVPFLMTGMFRRRSWSV